AAEMASGSRDWWPYLRRVDKFRELFLFCAMLDMPKMVPRFLPWRSGQIAVIYLTHVRVFAELLSVQVQYGQGWSDYIWADSNGPWETQKLTDTMKRETAKRLKVKLHSELQTRRLSRQKIRRSKGLPKATEEAEDPEAKQVTTISRKRAMLSSSRKPAVSAPEPADMQTSILGGFEKERLLKRLPASRRGAAGAAAAAAAAVDLTPFLQQSERQQREIEELRMKIKTQELELRFRQEQHSPKTPNIGLGIYNTNHGLPTPVTEESGNKNTTYGNTDTGSYDDNNNNPIYVEDDSQENEDLQHRPSSTLPAAVDSIQQYRLDDNTDRKRKEKHCKESCTATSVLTVVLPTAGGKTLLFTAPACLEEDVRVTIVVVPFRKLIDETVRDARKTVGDCEEWSHSTVDPAALVIVSVDKMHDHFWSYARQMVEQGRLRRVVVDECHLLVTSHSWRPHLVELEAQVTRRADGDAHRHTATIHGGRASTQSRSRYRDDVAHPGVHSAREHHLHRQARHRQREAGRRDGSRRSKMVCREPERRRRSSTAEARKITRRWQRLGCGLFYAGHVDGEETLEQWKAKGGFIVSTTALSTGLNYRAVKAVIHPDSHTD
ncbi:unnamed protein product, partial [Aureobasidium pullulans]